MGGRGDGGGDENFFCLQLGLGYSTGQPSLASLAFGSPLGSRHLPTVLPHQPRPGSALFPSAACTLAQAFHRQIQTANPAYSCAPPCPSSFQMVSSSTSPEVSLSTPLFCLCGIPRHTWSSTLEGPGAKPWVRTELKCSCLA